jgi:hypothetical protein
MKISLLNRILITLIVITATSLLLVWKIACPKYEQSILAERLSVIRQLQKSSIDNFDNAITTWSYVPRFITLQVTEKPNEGETVLHSIMMLYPEIIQMRIHSTGLSDELMSQNTSYPAWNVQISENDWVPSKIDSTLHVAWLHRTESPAQVFVMQTQFQVQNIPFVLTIFWDAKRLNTILTTLPFDKDYSISIHNSAGVIEHNTSSFHVDGIQSTADKLGEMQSVQEGTHMWRLFPNAFQSAQFWMVVAVPEELFSKPVEEFLLYSASLITGLMFLMSLLGWFLSYRLKHFIEHMKTILSTASES